MLAPPRSVREYEITYGGTLVYHHADDVAAAFIAAARTKLEGAPVYNLGGSTVSMAQIVAAIEEGYPRVGGQNWIRPNAAATSLKRR